MKHKKLIVGIVIATVVVLLITVGISGMGGQGTDQIINTQKIEKGDITSTISATGKLEEVEKAEVFFDTPVKVTKVLVEKNQKVKKGDKIFEIDTDSLQSQLNQLKAATADTSAADLDKNIKSAQKLYDSSVKNFENNKKLFEAGAISKIELDTFEKTVDDADSALQRAKSALTSQSSSALLNNLKISDAEKQLAKLKSSTLSPIDGIVSEINIQDGAFTNNMQSACKIVNPDKLRAVVNVSEYNSKFLSIGQKVKISGDAIDKQENVEGKISNISAVAKKNTSSSGQETVIEAIVAIDKTNKVLRPGLSVTCDITTQDKKSVLLISMQALVDDKDGNKFVFTVDPATGVVKLKNVQLGATSDVDAEITRGLNSGEMVILDPQPTLKDGSKIKINQDNK